MNKTYNPQHEVDNLLGSSINRGPNMFSRVNKNITSTATTEIGGPGIIDSKQNSTELNGQEKKCKDLPIRTSGFFLSSKHEF